MPAALTDKLLKVGVAGTLTNMTAPGKAEGTSSFNVASGSNYPTDTAFIVGVRQVDDDGNLVANTYTEWIATISGTTLTIDTTPVYGDDQVYSAGANTQVFIPVSAYAHNLLIDALLNEHNQDGSHSDITADSLDIGSRTWASLITGWLEAAESWSYSSYDSTNKTGVITVPTDATTRYSVGMRIRISQSTGGIKYGIITAVSSTSITVYFGTDYSLANEAISSPCYSTQKAPLGFSVNPAKWSVTVSNSNNRSVSGSSYGSLTDAITVPIGSWKLSAKFSLFFNVTTSTTPTFSITLSSDGSTETNPKLSASGQFQGSSAAPSIGSPSHPYRRDTVTVASATTFTLIGKKSGGTVSVLGSTGDPTTFIAQCAYL